MSVVVDSNAPPDHASSPVLVAADPACFRCSVWENVSMLIWTGQATLPALTQIRNVTESLVRSYPEGHSSVSFIAEGVPMPTPEARAALRKAFDDRVSQIKCMVQIIEGEGFWASTLRSTITSMKMNASHGLVMRSCTSIAEAVGWLPDPHRERTGVALDAGRLEQALHAFRGEADAAPAR